MQSTTSKNPSGLKRKELLSHSSEKLERKKEWKVRGMKLRKDRRREKRCGELETRRVQILKKEMEEALERKTDTRIYLKKTELLSSPFRERNLNKKRCSETQTSHLSQSKEQGEKLWQKADTGNQKSQRSLILEKQVNHHVAANMLSLQSERNHTHEWGKKNHQRLGGRVVSGGAVVGIS